MINALLEKQEVKKHVAAIHVKGRLSLLQRKVWNVLLLNAYEHLQERRRHSIRITHLAHLAGFDSKNQAFIKDTFRSLAKTAVEWNVLHDGKGEEWGIATLLASAKIRNGLCVYEYSSELAEKLYYPEIFAYINLRIQRNFRSGFGLALYENCVRFRGTVKKTTGFKSLDVWRDLLGVEEGSYEDYRNLRRRVLDPAIKEVNEFSDINVVMHLRRAGRKVIALRFDVNNNPQLALHLDMNPRKKRNAIVQNVGDVPLGLISPLVSRLAKLGLEDVANSLIKEYDEDRIAGNLDVVEERIKAGVTIKNIPAYTLGAIRKDYRPKKTVAEIQQEEKEAQKKEARHQKEQAALIAEQKARDEKKARDANLDRLFEELPPDEKSELHQQVLVAMSESGGMIWNKYRAEKEKGKVIEEMEPMVGGVYRTHRRKLIAERMGTIQE